MPLFNRHRAKAARAVDETVADLEAFLGGRYVEHLVAEGAHIPVWAWTNLLAHGTEDELRAVSDTADLPDETAQPASTGRDAHPAGSATRQAAADQTVLWLRARGYLAGEVLNMAGEHVTLHHLQRDVLIPLEGDLAACGDATPWNPAEWVTAVLAALDNYRHAPSHR